MVRRIITVYREAFADLPGPVWLISVAAFVNRAGTMVLPFLILYLTRELGYTKIAAGALMGVYGVGSIVGSYLGGWLSDRIGAVRVQVLSLALGGTGFLLLGQIERPLALVCFLLALSVAVESFRPAAMAATVDFAPAPVRTRALALLRLAVNLGFAIGPAAGGWLALYDYGWLFLVDAATCWAAAVLLLWRLRETRPVEEVQENGASRAGGSPLSDGPFMMLMVAVFLIGAVFFQLFSTWPLYLREVYVLRENAIGSLMALNALVIALVEMLLVRRFEQRDEMRVFAVGSLLVCGGFALMPLGSSAGWAVFTVLVWTSGEMLAMPFVNAVVGHRAGPGNRGRYMGVFTTTFSLSMVVAPLAGTAVYQRLGPHVLWYGVGLTGVLLFALCSALAPAFRRERRTAV